MFIAGELAPNSTRTDRRCHKVCKQASVVADRRREDGAHSFAEADERGRQELGIVVRCLGQCWEQIAKAPEARKRDELAQNPFTVRELEKVSVP